MRKYISETMFISTDAFRYVNSPCHPEGRYPLHIAAEYGSVDVVRLLLVFGADLSKLDLQRQNVVHYAAATVDGLRVLQVNTIF
jgi:hypothetical protein